MERRKRHENNAETDQHIEIEQEKSRTEEEKRVESDIEEGELDATVEVYNIYAGKQPAEGNSRTRTKSGGSVDMNALDYEDHGSDREDRYDVSFKTFSVFFFFNYSFYLFLF